MMSIVRKIGLGSFVATALMVGSANAAASLSKDAHITSTLVSAGVGEAIRLNCSTISPRYWVVLSKVRGLEKYAIAKGHSKADIKKFLRNKAEKKRIKNAAIAYLKANGVVKGQEETFCALGRAEIKKGSLTGQLLRAK